MNTATIRWTAALGVTALVGCSMFKKEPPPVAPSSTATYGASSATELPGMIEATRQEIQAKRTEIITAAMPMTETQGQKFWPVYREYRAEMQKLNDRTLGIVAEVVKQQGTLSADRAKELLNSYLDTQKKRVELQQDWVGKFSEVLTGNQVAVLYQLENKMDSAIAYDLAGVLPLAGGR